MTAPIYLLLLTVSVWMIFFRVKGRRLVSISSGSIILIWAIFVRPAEPSADIVYYNFVMSGETSPLLLGYVTEPVLWFSQIYLYRWTDSFFFAWLISDVFLLSLLFFAIKNLKYGLSLDLQSRSLDAFYPAIFAMLLISWPYFIGFNLTYRQFAAEIFLLCSISQARGSPSKSIVIFLIACLTHNAVAFFWPIIGVLTRKPFLKILSILVVISIPLIFMILPNDRESHYVGEILALLYPVFTLMICLVLIFLVTSQKIQVNKELIFINAFLPYLSINAWLFLPNGHAERFGQLTMAILLPILLVFVANKFREKRHVLVAATVFCAIPMLTFYSSMLK